MRGTWMDVEDSGGMDERLSGDGILSGVGLEVRWYFWLASRLTWGAVSREYELR